MNDSLHRKLKKGFCILSATLALQGSALAAEALTIYSEEWPPMSFSKNGRAEGMAVDVVRALQAQLGETQTIHIQPWARVYNALLHEPNTLLFSVGGSAERIKHMTLIGPIATSRTEIFARRDKASQLAALGEKLKNHTVASYKGSIFADAAWRAGFGTVDLSANPLIAAQKLMIGRVDLWVDGSLAVGPILEKAGLKREDIVSILVLESLDLYLAFSKGTPDSTIDRWEHALKTLKQSGGFSKIYRQWFPEAVIPMTVQRLGLSPAPRLRTESHQHAEQ